MNPVIVNEQTPNDQQWFALTGPQFAALRQSAPVENLLGFSTSKLEVSGGDVPEDVNATYLTENADYFFGVRALLGRNIQPSDAQGGGQPVVVLNYRFWQRHYSGDPHIVSRTLELDHVTYTIVGVMPRSFAFSDTTGVADVYLPSSLAPRIPNLPDMYIPWIKLKPHITPAAADAALEPLVRQFAKDNPRLLSRALASPAPAHHRSLSAGHRPYSRALALGRGAVAHHRLCQLLHPAAGPWPRPPA